MCDPSIVLLSRVTLTPTPRRFLPLSFLAVTSLSAQEHKLEKLWETDSVVAVPESVLPVNGTLYVSLIDGGGWDNDGKGGIAKIMDLVAPPP